MLLKQIVLLLAVIALSACTETPTKTDDQTNKSEKSPPKHMLSEQQKMIDKAKETEKLIKEADEKRRKALKDQGG